MYKLIALDLDDTLLGKDATIGATDAAAVAAARAAGCEVTLVTARSWRATKAFADELGLTLPVICMTGSAIYSPQGELLAEVTIPLHQARHLATLGDTESWAYRLYFRDGRIYQSRPADDYVPRSPAALYPIKEYTGELLPLLTGDEAPIQLAALGRHSVESMLAAVAELPDLHANTYDRHESDPRTHVMHREANKGAALRKYCERFGFNQQEVIAMGDGEPDRSMIDWAGTGVAMGWAPEHVRRVADVVMAANDPHPVATAIALLLGL